MITKQEIAAQRSSIDARLAEIALELQEDRKDTGAKRERAYLKRALKSLSECEAILAQLEQTKAALAALGA
jgi:hypothetical protein